MKMAYQFRCLSNGEGGLIAEAPDIPGTYTVGEDKAEALHWAQDALVVALSGYLDDRKDIPKPSPPKRGQHLVALPPKVAIKLAIYQAMRDQEVTQKELASRLGCDARQVRRILDLDHNSTLELLSRALEALGKKMVVDIQNAA